MHRRLNAERARVRSAKAAHAAAVAQQNELQAVLRAALERVRSQRQDLQVFMDQQPAIEQQEGAATADPHAPTESGEHMQRSALGPMRRRPVSAMPGHVAMQHPAKAAESERQRPVSALNMYVHSQGGVSGLPGQLGRHYVQRRPHSALDTFKQAPRLGRLQSGKAWSNNTVERAWSARRARPGTQAGEQPQSPWLAKAGVTTAELDSLIQVRVSPCQPARGPWASAHARGPLVSCSLRKHRPRGTPHQQASCIPH